MTDLLTPMMDVGLGLPTGNCLPSGGRIDFAAASACKYVEILRYPGPPLLVQRNGELDDTSLPT